jgi:hypothetical protein
MATQYAKDQPEGFTNAIERVAIIGAGGQMGSQLVRALLATGKHKVTAVTRPNSTSPIPEGLNVIKAEYTDHAALVSAFKGQQFLIITLSVFAPAGTHANLVKAAGEAGVPYIMPNWYGGDPLNVKLWKEAHLANSAADYKTQIEQAGAKHFFLACSFWYEFSLAGGPDRYGFDFHEKSLVLFDEGEVKINTTTWPQCGRAVAGLLSLKELPEDEHDKTPTLSQFANGTIYTSSFRINQKEMFESVKRVTGTRDEDWTVTKEPSDQLYQSGVDDMMKGNLKGFVRQLYTRAFFPGKAGEYESVRGLHNDVLGLPKEDLDEATKEAIRMAENKEVPY